MKYCKRQIEKVVTAAAKQFPSLILTGPRQSGKTTLLKHLFAKSHRYVLLDKPQTRLLAEDPELFFQNYPPPIIIDEIQQAPSLFSYIKALIEEKRHVNNRFILTGSQLFPLMENVSESLAGRIAVFTLLPLSLKEKYSSAKDIKFAVLKNNVLRGGYPQVALEKSINLDIWFSSYIQTYLERDVRQLRQVGNLNDFQRLLQLLASINGQVLNLSIISRDLGVAVNTVKDWISILEASGQVILVEPYYVNKGKRIVKSPKLYFLDTGILCFLAGITSPGQIFKGPLSGQFYETVVLLEMLKHFHNRGLMPRIYWWRTSSGDEVDFIVEYKGRIIPVEVKQSANATKEMARGLRIFLKLFADSVKVGYVVNMSKEKIFVGPDIKALPVLEFLKELG